MSESFETENEAFYNVAMEILRKTGHIDNSFPVFVNHTPEQFAYIDCENIISLSRDQRALMNKFQNVSFLFELGEDFFVNAEQSISFYSVELLCEKRDRSIISQEIHKLIQLLIGEEALIILFQHESEIMISFSGYGLGCILSEWYSGELEFMKLIEEFHVVNTNAKSAREYFLDLVHNVAREYYIYPVCNEMTYYTLLPEKYFLDYTNIPGDHEEINQLINDTLNFYKGQYGDDYVEYEQYDISNAQVSEPDLDFLLLSNEDDDYENILNDTKEKITKEDKVITDLYDELENMDSAILKDPEQMVRWIKKNEGN